MFELLYKPQKNISYSFILYSYAICSAIAVTLVGCEHILHLEAVHGYWIVFAPFIPCTIWAIVMKHYADAERSIEKAKVE